jgi:hypothetical protein
VRLWSSALSASDIADLAVLYCSACASSPPFAPSLLLHLRLSEGSGTTTANSAPLGGSATVAGAGVWQSPRLTCSVDASPRQWGLLLDSVGDFAVLPKPAGATFGDSVSFSVSVFFSSTGVKADPPLVRAQSHKHTRGWGYVVGEVWLWGMGG